MTTQLKSQPLACHSALKGSRKGLPLKLIEEVNAFLKRNSQTYSSPRGKVRDFCPQCLKAHLIKMSQTLHTAQGALSTLIASLDCKIGHEGYYLDGQKVIRTED